MQDEMQDKMWRLQLYGTEENQELFREQEEIRQANYAAKDAHREKIRNDGDLTMVDILEQFIPEDEKREYKTIMDVHLSILKGKMCDVFFSGVEKKFSAVLLDFDKEYLLMGGNVLVNEKNDYTTYREVTVSRKDIRMILRHISF